MQGTTRWLVAMTTLLLCLCASVSVRGDNPRDLKVLLMAPKSVRKFGVSAATSVGPLAIAIEKTMEDGMLHGHGINMTWLDSNCDPKKSIGMLVSHLLDHTPDVIFGPACTPAMEPVADLAAYLDIPVFSWVSNMPELDNKRVKSTLVRTVAPISSLNEILLFVCKRMKWYTLAMISARDKKSLSMADFFRNSMNRETNRFHLVRDFNTVQMNASQQDIREMYQAIRLEARVIVLVVPAHEVRRYLVTADEMDMTGGDYQFLYTEREIEDQNFFWELKATSFWQRGDGSDERARRAYHNLLYFTYQYVTFWLEQSGQEAAHRVFGSDPSIPVAADTPDKYAKFLHDAFYLYGLAFNQSMTLNSSTVPTGTDIFRHSKNQNFNGKSGRFLTNHAADRRGSFIIWDMGEDDVFRQVILAMYDLEHQLELRMINNILWGNKRLYNSSEGIYVPPDTPACGFSDEHCHDDDLASKLASTLSVTAMLAVVIAFLVIFRWWKKEKALYETVWKVKYSNLDFDVSRGPLSQPNVNSVSKDSTHASEPDLLDTQSFSTVNTATCQSIMRRDNMLMIAQMFTVVARLGGDVVTVRKINKKSIREDKTLLKEMQMMKALKHTNLATFYGACTESPHVCVLWEYCSKGSLQDILNNTDIKLEALFQFSIAVDIASGLHYLHTSELGVHGNLRASNCVVDSRWVAKLTDFGLRRFRKGEKRGEDVSDEKYYSDLMWTAPEILRPVLKNGAAQMTKEADIYSLGIILKQVLCKNSAYAEELSNYTPQEIVTKVAHPEPDRLMRPSITEDFHEQTILMLSFKRLVVSCWADDAALRPNIKKVVGKMKKISPLKSCSVVDNMLALMERYSNRLEDLVSERTLQLEEEKRKTDTLLYRMLPRKVADNLKRGEHVQAEAFSGVTIYFSDIVGFTTLASESQPMEIVEMLNLLYSHFDDIISNYDVYKVETIGDAYMVVSGCPNVNENHATVMAEAALALLDSVINFVIPHRPKEQLRIRIGLNSGPVVAGVVGNTMPRYCLFGNTVNLASRMESHGLPLKIQASSFTHQLIRDQADFHLEPRGTIEIKGKGLMCTYWLTRADTDHKVPVIQSLAFAPTDPPASGQLDCGGGDSGYST